MTTGPHWRDAAAAATALTRRARRVTLVSALVSLAIIAVAALIAHSWRYLLPTQLVAHWNSAGEPTRTTTLTRMLLPFLIGGPATIALFTAIGIGMGNDANTRKWIGAMNIWAGLFFGGYIITPLWFQRGLDGSEPIQMNALILGIIIGISTVGLLTTWALLPGDPKMPAITAIPHDAARSEVNGTQRAVWYRRIYLGLQGKLVYGGCVLLICTMTFIMHSLLMWFFAGIIALLVFSQLSYKITINSTGISFRSICGWPRGHVPIEEIVAASVTEVDPLAHFGGFGWRMGFGENRTGIVLRTGEALRIERTGGRVLYITTDDAENAVALINTFGDRSRLANED